MFWDGNYYSTNLIMNYLRAINRSILRHLTYDASRARIRGRLDGESAFG